MPEDLNSSFTCANVDKKAKKSEIFCLSWTNGLLEPAGLFWQIPHSKKSEPCPHYLIGLMSLLHSLTIVFFFKK